jgi:glycosyltransferase involved in cell wall biosynthesis
MSKNKKTILVCTKYYEPMFLAGGGVVTIVNLITSLKDHFNFIVICEDRLPNDNKTYKNIIADKWNWINNNSVKIIYVSPSNRGILNLKKIIDSVSCDLIFLNSFFSPFTTFPFLLLNKYQKKLKVPIVIAPRGELHDGALNHKKFKKFIYIKFLNFFNLLNGFNWLVTDNHEQSDVIKRIYNVKDVFICADIPQDLEKLSSLDLSKPLRTKESNNMNLVYISRILRKKGLQKAVEAVIDLSKHSNGDIVFDIYGPIVDNKYWMQCLKMIESNKRNNLKIRYLGELNINDVIPTFQKYHFFLFPTFGENYGYVVHESLLAGCPLIITNNTPWRNLKDKKVGFNYDNDKELSEILQNALEIDNNEFQTMSLMSQGYGQKISLESNSSHLIIKLFNKLIS